MSSARWKHKLKKFGALKGTDRWLLLRAAGWLAIARIMLIAVPFKRLSERLSSRSKSSPEMPDKDLLERIAYAVAAASNSVPWRSDCFPQAIAARLLLRRHGFDSTIHLGINRIGNQELESHAWLTCGETVVTGQGNLDRFAEIYRLGA